MSENRTITEKLRMDFLDRFHLRFGYRHKTGHKATQYRDNTDRNWWQQRELTQRLKSSGAAYKAWMYLNERSSLRSS